MAGSRWLRRHSLERRLFAWLLVLALVPSFLLLAAATWFWIRSFSWFGVLGPWENVAATGRAVFAAAADAAARDSVLAVVLETHRTELSESLLLARRWSFLGARLEENLPLLAVALAVFVAALSLLASRRLARQLARPIGELVEWTGRIARQEPLPAPRPRERKEVREFRVLREAFRIAQSDLAAGRDRAVAAERVRIWGEMARRVAHEMKNPLTPLRLAAKRLDAAARHDADLQEAADVIREETARLEELAAQFAALGRPTAGPRSEISLGELFQAVMASDVPPQVQWTLDEAPGVPLVPGFYEELLRAFRNVLKNAVEAMEGRAERRVDVAIRADYATGWAEVRVCDTGPGIPADALERIFDPDFSTKSRGTGLGLALVRQAILAHGGTVTATNREAGGAEIVIRLPAA